MTHSASLSRARFTGLDGLRAIAVALVVVYHLFPGSMLHSGFIGVDVFFVISGFLITSLLLRERAATGRIALTEFWRRRARRLLPALALLVTVTASWAWIVGGDVLVRLGWQVLGAATFSYNWISIAGGSDYFSADTPELFRNLWSLAVEEQFYWVWPLLLAAFLLIRVRWARMLVAIVAASASAAWMADVVAGGADPTRAYFGTDTHAFGLLLGVALAVGLERMLAAPPRWLLGRPARVVGTALGAAAITSLVLIALLPEQKDVATFPGTLAAASLAGAVAIVCGVAPRSRLGAALDVAPMRWVGDRSYGIYLWHWPLLVLVSAAAGLNAGSDTVPAGVGVLVLVLTLACAAVSYRFIEQPVRRLGIRGSLRALTGRLAGPPAARLRALGAVLIAVVVIGGTTAAITTAPAQTSGQSVVEAGQKALASRSDAPRPPLVDDDGPPPPPTAAEVDGRQIDAIGDSVMLASAPALMDAYPGIHIDAKVSRSLWAAPGIVDRLAQDGRLRRYVVLGLGTNGAVDSSVLDRVAHAIGPDRRLVLVTAFAPRSWIPGVNKRLHAYAEEHGGVIIADWAGAIAPHTDLLAGDRIHPGAAGGRYYATAISDAIAADQRARAQERLRMILRACQLAAPLHA